MWETNRDLSECVQNATGKCFSPAKGYHRGVCSKRPLFLQALDMACSTWKIPHRAKAYGLAVQFSRHATPAARMEFQGLCAAALRNAALPLKRNADITDGSCVMGHRHIAEKLWRAGPWRPMWCAGPQHMASRLASGTVPSAGMAPRRSAFVRFDPIFRGLDVDLLSVVRSLGIGFDRWKERNAAGKASHFVQVQQADPGHLQYHWLLGCRKLSPLRDCTKRPHSWDCNGPDS